MWEDRKEVGGKEGRRGVAVKSKVLLWSCGCCSEVGVCGRVLSAATVAVPTPRRPSRPLQGMGASTACTHTHTHPGQRCPSWAAGRVCCWSGHDDEAHAELAPLPPPSPTCTLSLHTAPPPHLQGVSCWSGNDDEAHAGRHGHHSLVSLAASLVASLAASLAASRSDPTPVCPPCTHPPPLLPHPLWPAGQPQTLACPTIQSADLSAPCHQADAHNLLANNGSTVPLCQAGSPWPPSPPPGWSTPPPSHR